MWEEADYSHCLYINDHTRVLSSFILMPVNSSTVLPLAHRLLAYTIEATSFLDMMDVIYVSQMVEKFIGWTGEIHELGELIVGMASNLMRVDAGVLRLAQQESGACTRVVRAVERIASLILTANSQTISKVSGNIAVEAFLVKPASFLGLGCTAFHRLPPPGNAGNTAPPPTLPLPLPLRFRCSAGNRNTSLTGFPIKNSEALAAVQLPPALFAGVTDVPRTNATCWLQFVAFRNGNLFPSTGNTSGLADRGQDRTPATPVIFTSAGGCGVEELAEPIQVSLRHWKPGDDQVAASWDFDLLDGLGGWQESGCQISQTQGNISTLRCHQFSNVVLLKRISNQSALVDESVRSLHPIIYTCTAFLLLCIFTAIIAYILRHNTIGISKKSWHMLLNLWFHISMSCAVFTGGINRKDYGLLCQVVGIVLHYSSLSTLLWIGVSARVIYKEATQKLQRQQELELPAPAQRPMLRFYLIAGGIPLIICGITAAVNLHNYSNVSPYCWLAWKPSLGAFYVPAGFTILVSWIYLLGAGLQLGCRRRGKADAGGLPEQPAVSSDQGPDSASVSGPSPATDLVYSLEARLWALAGTQLLFIGLWMCGALSVWGMPPLAVLFSCLYGVGAVALGLLVLIHHCLRRHDVCGPWRGWARRQGAEAGGSPTSSPAGPGPEAGGSPFSAGGQCKMTNLQAALSQGDRGGGGGGARSPTPCVDNEAEAEEKAPACRGHRARTKPPVDGKQQRLRALRAAATATSDAASSDTGSGRLSNGRPGRHASHSPSEGSDSSGQAPGSGSGSGPRPGLQASVSRDSLKQAGPLEKEVKRRSYPQNGAQRAGETGATISAGLWKSETTV
ncbi:adhesion G protein-coupled receptor A2-like [Leucoraja erinacea]|uniref:adhesion G protein-coupled receptor A2-like n=1 Tax=Leucoraja erinaceus TaxID=7782 RepID=UPI002456ED10|nr:adhesion G protein-coupled receptor A2-like [Leucoraja erinacea]